MPEPTSSPQVLRITRSDEPESFVLLRVSSSRSKALDLDIAATEGENPYTGSIRQSRLKNFRAKNYQGTDDEWTQVVSYVFGQPVTSNNEPEWTSGVEASASISGSGDDEDNRELVITVRKRIQTITQRLGTITLKQDDDQAIELFDWAGVAITRADALEKQSSSLSHRCHLAEDTIQQLNRQLEELICAKSQHEDQLVANFAQLLNEKKLKIRNQQRLLASATVDPEKVSAIQAATSNEGRDSTRKDRRPKRGAQEMNQEESESEDGFETMEVDQDKNQDREAEQETDDEQPSTPEPLEDESDGTTDNESAPPPIEDGKKGDGAPKPSINRPPLKEPAVPPPRRELPFARRVPEQKETRRTEVDAESTDGETDDDEL